MNDPYSTLEWKNRKHLNITVSNEDMQLIRAVCPNHGTIQLITSRFLASVAAELRSLGIVYYTPEHSAIFTQLIERRTSAVTPCKGLHPDDTGRASLLHSGTPAGTNLSTNTPLHVGDNKAEQKGTKRKAKRTTS